MRLPVALFIPLAGGRDCGNRKNSVLSFVVWWAAWGPPAEHLHCFEGRHQIHDGISLPNARCSANPVGPLRPEHRRLTEAQRSNGDPVIPVFGYLLTSSIDVTTTPRHSLPSGSRNDAMQWIWGGSLLSLVSLWPRVQQPSRPKGAHEGNRWTRIC